MVSASNYCYPVEEADDDWENIIEKGRGQLNGLDALNLGGGWVLISGAEVGDNSCHLYRESNWYTEGKTLDDIKEHAKASGYGGFSMITEQGNGSYGNVYFKKCRHKWYGSVHNLEERTFTDFYLYREEDF